jgi:hypothetical protein
MATVGIDKNLRPASTNFFDRTVIELDSHVPALSHRLI